MTTTLAGMGGKLMDHTANVDPLKQQNAISKKRKKNLTPDSEFQQSLAACSREGNLDGALALYRNASIRLNAYHFNTLLHIFSNAIGSSDLVSNTNYSADSIAVSVNEAFNIFEQMVASGITPSESTITSMSRIAAADRHDGGIRAFELVKNMKSRYDISPRLRTYDPSLFAFCRQAEDAEKAYDVEDHMMSMGIMPEEGEIAALLKVSSDAGKEGKVYEYLHKLRRLSCLVSPSTVEILKGWFESDSAVRVGSDVWDVDKVKESILLNGGGWHGQGWLGKGQWKIKISEISSVGCCLVCQEQLACVDLDGMETEKLAESVASLARAREAESNFSDFQEWLDNHDDYDVIVDAANVGYYHQNFADGGFSLTQVHAVVEELIRHSYAKKPLIVLHNKRVRSLMEDGSNRELLESWTTQGSLYATPTGSNDDWYWIYAAVRLRVLLLTNDEMRDHIFETLGQSFFTRWKERHQVRYSFVKGDPKLEMPRSYTDVIQESATGSWHIPIQSPADQRDKDHKSEGWLCITRLHPTVEDGPSLGPS